jgi:hypothetical protein
MDIGATLWPTAVDVELGDWSYQIPEYAAATWIEAIASPDGGAIVPGLLEPEDQRLVWRDVVMGRMHPDRLAEAWRDVVGAATGRPWWESTRQVLSATTKENWPFIQGKLAQRGVDLDRCSIGAFCNIVHMMAIQACEGEQERSQFEFDLTTPPPGVDPEEAHAATDAAADFLSAMQQFQNLGPGGPARETG